MAEKLHGRTPILGLRIVQLVFAIIALGLSADIVHILAAPDYFGYGVSISQINFNVFQSLFCILTLVYLIGHHFLLKPESPLAHPLFSLVLDFLNWIFWLAAFASVVAFFQGIVQLEQAQVGALIAFGVLEWLLFSATLALSGLAFFKKFRGHANTDAANTQPTPMTAQPHQPMAQEPIGQIHQGV